MHDQCRVVCIGHDHRRPVQQAGVMGVHRHRRAGGRDQKHDRRGEYGSTHTCHVADATSELRRGQPGNSLDLPMLGE